MKKRSTAVAAGLICLGLIWLFLRHKPTSIPPESGDAENREEQISIQGQHQSEAKAPITNGPIPVIDKTLDFSNALDPGFAVWKRHLQRPIEFYGKVVDEELQPVSAATITLSANQFLEPHKVWRTNLVSDTAGLFSVRGLSGTTLGVNVKKQGYISLSQSNRSYFDFREDLDEPRFSPNPADPVLFHLRKRGAGVELITSAYGMQPDMAISGLTNGRPIWVDFYTRKVGLTGQLEISAIKPGPTDPSKDWSFSLRIPNGGFVERSNGPAWEAPGTGYVESVSFVFQQGQPQYTQNLSKHYYIVFGNPRTFGTLDVDTGIYRGVRLGYAINPDGSRNLEPKNAAPEQRQTPPGVTESIPEGLK